MGNNDLTSDQRSKNRQRQKLQTRPATFQERCGMWAQDYFEAEKISSNFMGQLFIAAAIELFQATGGSKDDALVAVEVGFEGEFDTKSDVALGDVMIATACLSNQGRINMSEAGEVGLRRAWVDLAAVRARQVAADAAQSKPTGKAQ